MTSEQNFPANRTAVLTGAAFERGIGRSTADKLATLGWNIAIVDIDATAARAAASDIARARGVHAIGVGADVSDHASVDAAISQIEASMRPHHRLGKPRRHQLSH